MLSKIVPEKTGPWIVHIGNALVEGVAEILRTVTSSINNGPDFFDVIGSGGSIGPQMAVGGYISTIEKVVEHPELQCEFMGVGRNQRRTWSAKDRCRPLEDRQGSDHRCDFL